MRPSTPNTSSYNLSELRIYSLYLVMVSLFLLSCEEEKEAKLTVKNEVSNVQLQDVYFDGEYLSYGPLLPGQSASNKYYGKPKKWPKVGPITFIMYSNNKQVYLVTDSIYTLMAGTELEVIIDDDTPVSSY